MKGQRKSFIIPATILLTILSIYSAKGQSKTVADETQVKYARKQTYIETVNNKIAYLAIKELNIQRYSKELNSDNDTIFRLSVKRSDINDVLVWFDKLKGRRINLKRN